MQARHAPRWLLLLLPIVLPLSCTSEPPPEKPVASSEPLGVDDLAPPSKSVVDPEEVAGIQPGRPAAAEGDASEEKPAPDEITVTKLSAPDFARTLGEMETDYVFVDCWATWCIPCVQSFPKMLDLAKKYADDDRVRFVTAANEEDDVDPVLAFLKERNATMTANYFIEGDLIDTADLFGWKDASLPHYMIIGNEGKADFSTGKFEEAKAQLEKLLSK